MHEPDPDSFWQIAQAAADGAARTADANHPQAFAINDGTLFADDRALFTACLDSRRAISSGEEIELAIDCARLHLFDPETGHALATPA